MKSKFLLVRYFFKRWPSFILYFAAIVTAPVVHMYSTYYTADLTDYATSGQYKSLLSLIWVVFAFFLLHGLCLYVISLVRAYLIRCAREDMKKDMFCHLMTKTNGSFSDNDTGRYIASFSNDISLLEYKFFGPCLDILQSLFSAATAAAAIIYLNHKLAAAIICCEMISVTVCFVVRRLPIRLNREYIDTLASFTQKIKDFSSAFRSIVNFNAEHRIFGKYQEINKETEVKKTAADMSLSFANTLAGICHSITRFVVCGYGVVLLIHGEITYGLIYAAYSFANSLVSPLSSTIEQINSIESVQGISNRIAELAAFHTTDEIDKAEDISQCPEIRLENVRLFIGRTDVLKGVSFVFEPAKKYLVIGRNGSGKSSLLKLIKRNLDTYEGHILIDGHELRDVSYQGLARRIAYLNEAVGLACDTVRNNITLWRETNELALQDAVSTVGLKVPLDRVVRDGERNLSSGEQRRVAIARTILNHPGVIIFDEAISTIDIINAYEIEKMLLSMSDRTVIFVSHNFSSLLIDQYDEILLMDSGHIIAHGSHCDMMRTCPQYRNIIELKNG